MGKPKRNKKQKKSGENTPTPTPMVAEIKQNKSGDNSAKVAEEKTGGDSTMVLVPVTKQKNAGASSPKVAETEQKKTGGESPMVLVPVTKQKKSKQKQSGGKAPMVLVPVTGQKKSGSDSDKVAETEPKMVSLPVTGKKKSGRKGPKFTEGKMKNQGRNGPNVSESARSSIAQRLRDFRDSNLEVYTFEENLSNNVRAEVHLLSRKLGLRSKSSGKGKQRRVSVFKTKKTLRRKKEKIRFFTFSEESKAILFDLFSQYPPGCDDMETDNFRDHNKKRQRRQYDDAFCNPKMSKDEIAKELHSLTSRVTKTQKMKEISRKRSSLPIAASQDCIISSIDSHQVVLICGETGCGKTTQVPQYILDNMWRRGESCKIICTQPRRISATSVAERVSQERGEEVGGTIGYKIRLESKGGKKSSILFCTNGVLLRVLVAEGTGGTNSESSGNIPQENISEITHIVVDEIHERDHYCDFMLAILRDLLSRYSHLRLVLMSATLDAERFSQYFGGCPIIHVPGFTYPVKSFYLEEVLSFLQSTKSNHLNDTNSSSSVSETPELSDDHKIALDEAINSAQLDDEFDMLLNLISSKGTSDFLNYQHSITGVTPLMVLSEKGRTVDVCMLLSLGANFHLKAKDGSTALDWAKKANQDSVVAIISEYMKKQNVSSCFEEKKLLEKYLSSVNPEMVDIFLIVQLLRKICGDSRKGAILIFLPGWEDINRTRDSLLSNSFFKDSSKFQVICLHSMVPSSEQKKVFQRPPHGCRKIVLSTNIAETAVTIDDVVYVIDSGRMKEKSYDPYNNVSTLQSAWISKASAKQREGRAGRCQPGFCYHLYSKVRADSFSDFPVPEIRRMPIEELCLQVKLLDPNYKIEEFLKKTMDPPVSETIQNAVIALGEIGALSHDEELTELGKKLGSLPVHPRTSKMLLFAILMNCLDPALTLACASNSRSPFTLPMLPDEKKRASAAKSELASLYGGYSDQLAVIAAFECWKNATEKGQQAAFCSLCFVNTGTMRMLSHMRKQLQRELIHNGFISEDVSTCNRNARNPGIVRAVLVAGAYPQIGRLLPATQFHKNSYVETASGEKVRLHYYSLNTKISVKKTDENPLIIYDEITRGDTGLHIRNCTVIGSLPLLLVAAEIVVAPGREREDDGNGGEDGDGEGSEDKDENTSKKQGQDIMSNPTNTVNVIVDRWLSFESTAIEVAKIYCLRERILAANLFRITHPRQALPPALKASVYAIACVLSYDDGLSGLSKGVDGHSGFLEGLDDLISMIYAADIGSVCTRSMIKQRKCNDPVPSLRSLFFESGQHSAADLAVSDSGVSKKRPRQKGTQK